MPDANTGKLLYDAVVSKLGVQKDDLAALTGRAKDLLGLTSLAGTATSLVANDKLFELKKKVPPPWWVWAVGIVLAIAIASGILALLPRKWSLSTDPVELVKTVDDSANAEASDDDFLRAIADGFLAKGKHRNWLFFQKVDMAFIDGQNAKLRRLSLLVTLQAIALGCVVGLAFLLLIIL